MSSTRTATARRTTSARRPPARRPTTRRRPPGRSAPVRRGPARTAASWGWLAAVLAVVALVALSIQADGEDVPMATAECTLPVTGVRLTGEQVGNARTIAQVGYERGLPERAVVIALATAMQESRLRNLDYGDRDSLGLFQQRPSQGWGTPAQVQDPVYAAGKFYDGLVQVPGWDSRRLTEAADAVQRSAFPEAYQKHEGMAVELVAALDLDAVLCD
ncbi:MAG TPA: hypothetical protein VE823_13035 [Geodermatophilus sp.]|nr:hypothetical protein [Geodermatophilus sp.]